MTKLILSRNATSRVVSRWQLTGCPTTSKVIAHKFFCRQWQSHTITHCSKEFGYTNLYCSKISPTLLIMSQ